MGGTSVARSAERLPMVYPVERHPSTPMAGAAARNKAFNLIINSLGVLGFQASSIKGGVLGLLRARKTVICDFLE